MMETQRLIFRKYTMSDLDFLMKMTSDPDVMRYIGEGTTCNEMESRQKLERFLSWYEEGYGVGLMMAIRKADGVPVGHAGLISQVVEGIKETEVGYWIAQEFWGIGYATESAQGWRDYGINTLGIHRLISLIQFGNSSSIKVAIKNGMSFEREIIYHSKSIALYSLEKLPK